LLPAVNNAREAGRRATCQNNQRNFAQAIMQYVSAKDYMPGYRLKLKQDTTSPAAYYPTVSWQIAAFAYMGREDVYQTWQTAAPSGSLAGPWSGMMAPYMDITVCPSDNTIAGKGSQWTSYIVNSGRLDLHPTGSSVPAHVNLPDTSPNGIIAGVFQDHIQPSKVKVSLTDIKDGQSTTLLTSENLDARYYVNQFGAMDQDNSERGTSFLYWWTLAPTSAGAKDTGPPPNLPPPPNGAGEPKNLAAINGGRGDYDPNVKPYPPFPTAPTSYSGALSTSQYLAARPSSNHPGGVVVTFVGGNVKFLTDDTSYDVFCCMMTPAGSKFWTPEPVIPQSD